MSNNIRTTIKETIHDKRLSKQTRACAKNLSNIIGSNKKLFH